MVRHKAVDQKGELLFVGCARNLREHQSDGILAREEQFAISRAEGERIPMQSDIGKAGQMFWLAGVRGGQRANTNPASVTVRLKPDTTAA